MQLENKARIMSRVKSKYIVEDAHNCLLHYTPSLMDPKGNFDFTLDIVSRLYSQHFSFILEMHKEKEKKNLPPHFFFPWVTLILFRKTAIILPTQL